MMPNITSTSTTTTTTTAAVASFLVVIIITVSQSVSIHLLCIYLLVCLLPSIIDSYCCCRCSCCLKNIDVPP